MEEVGTMNSDYIDVRDLKKLEGKEIYLSPTGNNARGSLKSKITVASVIKVARVFITIKMKGYRSEEKLRISGRHEGGINLDCGYNSGYIMYDSIEKLEERKEILSLSRNISDEFRYQSDYSKLDLETLKKLQNY